MSAGYSQKSLAQKLGVKSGAEIVAVNPPARYAEMLGALPPGVVITDRLRGGTTFIHCFVTRRAALESLFPALKQKLAPDGMLWVSWPKRASGVETALNENAVREIGLQNSLVDVKVIAVDETWSGLKFVFRLKDRREGPQA